jgi:dimethylamine--corrinoid protein Co-methyltransferase
MGDPLGMAITHSMAAGMGGVRAAGDLVARMQMARGMKLGEAKEYVASRLKVSVRDLTDEAVMNDVRRELNLGLVSSVHGYARGLEAKFQISKLLGIEINCVNRSRLLLG